MTNSQLAIFPQDVPDAGFLAEPGLAPDPEPDIAPETLHQIYLADSRKMLEVDSDSVHLVVTSPPYWQLKDYGAEGQIGFDQSFEEYIADLNRVWEECQRVLHPGCRACINIGDQFARAETYGRYQVLPIHAEVISGMRNAGMDYMGSIIWQKVTTCNTTGGGSVMGSYPYPRNGIVKLDYEYVLLFKKPGEAPRPDPESKAASRLDSREWGACFSGHWNFPGARASRHLAPFPMELPRRLIRMFTFRGDSVLDPFLGSAVTTAAARLLGRNSIGYEINPRFLNLALSHADLQEDPARPCRIVVNGENVEMVKERLLTEDQAVEEDLVDAAPSRYGSVIRAGDRRSRYEQTFRVAAVEAPDRLRFTDGAVVTLAGVRATGHQQVDSDAVAYLKGLVRPGRVVVERLPQPETAIEGPGFVRLLNRTFLNGKLVQHGLARFDENTSGRFLSRLRRYELDARQQRVGIWQYETE